MRIYGTSPLYNYVELIFRCKRMFIVAILLGTILTSSVVYSRDDSYKATMLVTLAGDATMAAASKGAGAKSSGSKAKKGGGGSSKDAVRKASRLTNLWLERDPEFIPDILKDAGLETKYGEKFNDIVKEARKQIKVEKNLISGIYMTVGITWPDPKEAEDILNKLYARFSDRTVAEETAQQTTRRQLLEEHYNTYSKKADEATRKLLAFREANNDYNPALHSSLLQKKSALEDDIDNAELDLNDVRTRLAQTRDLLRKTPPTIEVQRRRTIENIREDAGLRKELDEAKELLAAYEARYEPSNPKLANQKKKVEELTLKLEAAKKKPTERRETGEEVQTEVNPAYSSLQQSFVELQQAEQPLQKRLAKLRETHAEYTDRLKRMPGLTNEFDTLTRDQKFMTSAREQYRALLAKAKMDEDNDKMTQALQVDQAIAPKAERVDTSAKLLLLYALGPILGLVIAFCFSLLAESLDHTLRTPVEVEKYLGKPVLAVIPKMQKAKGGRKALGGAKKASISS